jgi:hypothetical protein
MFTIMNDHTPHENSNQLLQSPNPTPGRTYLDYNLKMTEYGGPSPSTALMTEILSCGIRIMTQIRKRNHRSERSENGIIEHKSNRHRPTSFKLATTSSLPEKALSTPLLKLATKQLELTTQNYLTRLPRNQPVLRRRATPHTRNGFKLR